MSVVCTHSMDGTLILLRNGSGDDTIKLYLWMDRLREQAPAKGGHVLTHLGNHEWMNAIGTNVRRGTMSMPLMTHL